MNNVDIGLLRVFLVLMAERNVSRAAARLDLSQPATSHALARLRALFDDPLLLRSRDGMAPTERALEIERTVAAMLIEYDRLVTPPSRFEPNESRRTFVLTATEYSELVLLPPLMARVRAQAPNVQIEIRAPNQQRMLDWLESGEVDLRIGWVRDATPSLRSRPLFHDNLVCIARRDHPHIQGAITLAQYLSLPHARPQIIGRTTIGRVIDDAVRAHGGKLRIVLGLQNFLTIPRVVAESDIVATLPRRLAEVFVSQLPLQVIEPPLRLPRMRYAAYWHNRSHNDVGHQWLRRMLTETARDIQHSAPSDRPAPRGEAI
jgi:DNA-binding transcriptional LysR family regulator